MPEPCLKLGVRRREAERTIENYSTEAMLLSFAGKVLSLPDGLTKPLGSSLVRFGSFPVSEAGEAKANRRAFKKLDRSLDDSKPR